MEGGGGDGDWLGSCKSQPPTDVKAEGSVAHSWFWRSLGQNAPGALTNRTFLEHIAEDKLVHKEKLDFKFCDLPGYPRSTFLMVFSPDGTTVASTHGNHNIYLTALSSGKNLRILKGHPRTPWCIDFHPSHPRLVGSGCLGGQVRVWDLSGGSEAWTVENETEIASIAFHPRDQLLVVATYNELYFWDWSQPAPFTKVCTNNINEKVRYVAFDSLGHKLITGISVWSMSNSGPSIPQPNMQGGTPSTNSQPGAPPRDSPESPPNQENPEDLIVHSYRNLAQRYDSLVRNYHRLFLARSQVANTTDRGTDPMEMDWYRIPRSTVANNTADINEPVLRRFNLSRFAEEHSPNLGPAERESSHQEDPTNASSAQSENSTQDGYLERLFGSRPSAFQPLNENGAEGRLPNRSSNYPSFIHRVLPNPFSTLSASDVRNRANQIIASRSNTTQEAFDRITTRLETLINAQQNDSSSRTRAFTPQRNTEPSAQHFTEPSGSSVSDNTRNFNFGPLDDMFTARNDSRENIRLRVDGDMRRRALDRLLDLEQITAADAGALRANLQQNITQTSTAPTNQSTESSVPTTERIAQSMEEIEGYLDLSVLPNIDSSNIPRAPENPANETLEAVPRSSGIQLTPTPPTTINESGAASASTQSTASTSQASQNNENSPVSITQSLDIIRDILRDSGTRLLNLITDMSYSTLANVDAASPGDRANSQSHQNMTSARVEANRRRRDINLFGNTSSSETDSDHSLEVNIYRTRNASFPERNDSNVTNNNQENEVPRPTSRMVVNLGLVEPSEQPSEQNSTHNNRINITVSNNRFRLRTNTAEENNTQTTENNPTQSPAEPNYPSDRSITLSFPVPGSSVTRTLSFPASPNLHNNISATMPSATKSALSTSAACTSTPLKFAPSTSVLRASTPSTSAPSKSVSRASEPFTSVPSSSAAFTFAPSTSAASTSAPSTSAPGASAPSTSAPSTPAPGASAPSTSALSTSAPSTSAPSTSAPSTSALSTSAPSTSAPSTSGPSTSAESSTFDALTTSNITSEQSSSQRTPNWQLPSTSRDTESNFQRNLSLNEQQARDPLIAVDALRKVKLGVEALQRHTFTLTDMWLRGSRASMRDLRMMWEDLRRQIVTLHRQTGRTESSVYFARSLLERCHMLTDLSRRALNRTMETLIRPNENAGNTTETAVQANMPSGSSSPRPSTSGSTNRVDSGDQPTTTRNASDSSNSSNSRSRQWARYRRLAPTATRLALKAKAAFLNRRRMQSNLRSAVGEDFRRQRIAQRIENYLQHSRASEGHRRGEHFNIELHLTRHEIRVRAMQVLSMMFNVMMACLEEGQLSTHIMVMLRNLKRALGVTCLLLMTQNRRRVSRNSQTFRRRNSAEPNTEPLDLRPSENTSQTSTHVSPDATQPIPSTSNETPPVSVDIVNVPIEDRSENANPNPNNGNPGFCSNCSGILNQPSTSNQTHAAMECDEQVTEQIQKKDSEGNGAEVAKTDSENSSNAIKENKRDSIYQPSTSSASKWSNRLAVQISAANKNQSDTANRRKDIYQERKRMKALHRYNPLAHPLIKRKYQPLVTHRIPTPRTVPPRRVDSNQTHIRIIPSNVRSEPVPGPSNPQPSTSQNPPIASTSRFSQELREGLVRMAQRQAFRIHNANRSRNRVRIRLYTPSSVREMFDILTTNPDEREQQETPPTPNNAEEINRRPFSAYLPNLLTVRNNFEGFGEITDGVRPFGSLLNSVSVPLVHVNNVPLNEQAGPPNPPRVNEYLQPIILAQEAVGGGLLEAGLISESLVMPVHRVQAWDFTGGKPPDIKDSTKNVVVQRCKIHNDASIDISRDGRLLVALLPVHRMRNICHRLGVYSLEWNRLGECLHTVVLEQSAVSVSLSPTARHLAVGLGSRRVTTLPNTRNNVFALLYKLADEGPVSENSRQCGLVQVRMLDHNWEHGFTSLNCLRWAPSPGQGLLYANNTGQLIMMS